MRVHYPVAFVVSAIVSYATLSARDADATTRYFHAGECTASNLNNITYSNGQAENGSTGAVNLVCPVLYGTDFSVTSTSTVKVNGYEHSQNTCLFGDVTMQTCRTYQGGGGGACGTAANPSSCAATFSVTVSANGWPSGSNGDFYYVYVQLGGVSNGQDDVLFGYYITA